MLKYTRLFYSNFLELDGSFLELDDQEQTRTLRYEL